MDRSLSLNRIYLAAALVAVLAASAFFFARQRPIPVTGMVSPASAVQQPRQSLDLGAGYRLESDGTAGKIVAPDVMLKPEIKALDLGAGYRLESDGSMGRIVAPEVMLKSEMKTLDLGAGYKLALDGKDGKIIAPASPVKTSMQVAAESKTYVGGGYWLVIGEDGGRLVPGSTP